MSGLRIDVPYAKSPPVIFTFRQTANLALGQYDFGGVTTPVLKSVFTPDRPLQPNALYLFNTLSFSMDIDETDYQSGIQTLPAFQAYVQSDAAAPAFREALALDKYFENYPYRLSILGNSSVNETQGAAGDTFNKFFGSITGVLNQTASLVGKAAVTGIVKFTAQEITDKTFISDFIKVGLNRVDKGRA